MNYELEPPMNLYAASIKKSGEIFIEFYWAEDGEHAAEQAVDSHSISDIQCVALVPPIYTKKT